MYPLWIMLGWRELVLRYKRSTLGPFWITLSMAAMVGALGLVYGTLFGLRTSEYLPFLAIGLVLWYWYGMLVNDGCMIFVAATPYLKQVALPKSVFVFQMGWRSLLIFLHNAVIIVGVLLWFRVVPDPSALWAVPLGVIATLVTGMALATASGLISARFRDLPQVVTSFMQVLFFVTPVMYRGDMLKEHQWIMSLNPFHHYMELVRRPLLGEPASLAQSGVVAIITLVSVGLSMIFFVRYRRRLTYWL